MKSLGLRVGFLKRSRGGRERQEDAKNGDIPHPCPAFRRQEPSLRAARRPLASEQPPAYVPPGGTQPLVFHPTRPPPPPPNHHAAIAWWAKRAEARRGGRSILLCAVPWGSRGHASGSWQGRGLSAPGPHFLCSRPNGNTTRASLLRWHAQVAARALDMTPASRKPKPGLL